jgi:hypothetical protein
VCAIVREGHRLPFLPVIFLPVIFLQIHFRPIHARPARAVSIVRVELASLIERVYNLRIQPFNPSDFKARIEAMKKLLVLIPILFSLNLAHGNSRYVTLTARKLTETVLASDVVEIVGVTTSETSLRFDLADGSGFSVNFPAFRREFHNKHIYTGAVSVTSTRATPVTLKITPASVNATTSKPVIVPPTSASDDKVNVQLQVSTDLKNWEDVAPGEFLGSNTARFFRVKTTTGNPE